jgi:hypothetical protein
LQIVIALPWLFGHNPVAIVGHASSDHLVRDGAIGVVIAIAGLIASYDPTRARTLCLVSAAALLLQLFAGLLDEHERHVTFDFELTHLLAIAIVILLGLIARAAPFGPARPHRRVELRPLRGPANTTLTTRRSATKRRS